MKRGLAAALFLAFGTNAFAHRLDEYLQATILAVEKDRLAMQMTLTPGVAVFPSLISQIDSDADGAISETEQRAYAARVLRDLSFTLDGKPLTLKIVSMRFPATGEMKMGRGEIQLNSSAQLPTGGRKRKLLLENHHESSLSVYQVNCLRPQDPDIQITAQERNFTQSSYRLEYTRNDVGSGVSSAALWFGGFGWLGLTALILMKRMGRIE